MRSVATDGEIWHTSITYDSIMILLCQHHDEEKMMNVIISSTICTILKCFIRNENYIVNTSATSRKHAKTLEWRCGFGENLKLKVMSLTCSCLWFTSTRQTLSKITDFTYSMAWFSQSFKSSNYLQFSARIFNVHYLNIVYSSLLLPLSKEATYQKSLPKTLGVHVLDKFPDLHWYSNLVTLKAKWKWVAFSTGRCSISSS